ncbi:MAG TPA: glycosyltransferase family 4 protein [Chloroflexota bacterium]
MIRLTVSMRVVHVVPTQFGSAGLFGGGERYPLELARALASELECELITFGPRASLARDDTGLTIRVVRSFAALGGHPAHPLAPGLLTALHGADIVHTHHMRSTPSSMSAVTAQLRGQHIVTTDHGLRGSDWGGLLPRLFERFLAVSEYSARVLGMPHSRVRVIYGGADPKRFSPDPHATREGVLFVGRITPHKGVDRAIAALPAGATLTIAGSEGHDPHPPERDYPHLLQRMAAEHDVTFLGPVLDEELPALYRRAAVLVLPSVHRTCYGRDMEISELLGLVVLEAMASGTPVVCSALGGLCEVVHHGETGFLVEPGNVDELRERLTELLENRPLARRMGENARARALERFTWEACADRCLSAYDEL